MVQRKKSLRTKFRKITIIPLVIFAFLTLIITSILIYTSLRDETKDGLQHLSQTFLQICDLSGKGDYHIVDSHLYRGDKPFDLDHTIVDRIKNDSSVDATIFWRNNRISTTIKNENGTRAVGTTATKKVTDSVLLKGKEYFSDSVKVNNVPYFGNYIPLRNSNEKIVGMLFVGKSRTTVMHTIYRSIMIISSVLILMILFVTIFSLSFSQKIIQALQSTKNFLGCITKGDVDTPLDDIVLQRDDEIGEMGRFSIILQKSVTELINTDALTGLYNRRSCTLFLQSAIKEYQDHDIPFFIVIADIDDFKGINDTYGHLAGDEVLRNISTIFKSLIGRDDMVARWGGEEFLFIFKRKTTQEVSHLLKSIQNEIRHMKYSREHDDEIIVTMTFGVCNYKDDTDIERVLKNADDRLYFGKDTGKDRIILSDSN